MLKLYKVMIIRYQSWSFWVLREKSTGSVHALIAKTISVIPIAKWTPMHCWVDVTPEHIARSKF